MTSRIVGIDIGSVSVRGVELKTTGKDKPVISRFHEVPLLEGSVRRGEVLEVSTVAEAIRRLWSAGGFKTKDVVLGMGGPRVLSRELTMPMASLPQIREQLPFHVQELLPVPVGDALLDFYPISEGAGESGPIVHGLLVAAIKEAVAANIAAVTSAGLRPVHVDLIPFALSRALAPIKTSVGLIAVVGIGANTTNVVIAKDGVPQFVRIIPTGGDDITRALSARLDLPAPKAEELKRSLGLGSPGRDATNLEAIETIYESAGELLTSIRNTITYFVNGKNAMELNGIVLSGGGSRLSGLALALGELTGVEVTQADALGGGKLPGNAEGSIERQDAMTTAFGLALGSKS